MVVSISSIPRWHLARGIFSDRPPSGDQDKMTGFFALRKALRSVIEDTRYILRKRCSLVEFIVSCVPDPEIVRIHAMRALLRTVVYLVYKAGGCFRS